MRGLGGAVGENLTDDGLRLELSVPCPDLDVASPLALLTIFGLSWAL